MFLKNKAHQSEKTNQNGIFGNPKTGTRNFLWGLLLGVRLTLPKTECHSDLWYDRIINYFIDDLFLLLIILF